ncbi:MAG: hypothetical protein P1U89_06680 [Verrucomicrobiales bacterium]|nr:hypothetical protein [Verrucomicrobiales bacterium]
MSDFPFKPPTSNPFSSPSKKTGGEIVEPTNRVENVVLSQPRPAPIEKPKQPLPPLKMEEKTCRTCEYYAFDESMIRAEAYKGECRRHAPNPGNEGQAFWPEVPWKSWCGEWGSGVSNEDMVRMARDIGEGLSEEEF